MEQTARDAERLQAALEAGSGFGPLRPDEPESDLAAMLGVADQLRGAAVGQAGDPRPSFVLGLEEQLRTDFRLQPPQPLSSSASSRWSGTRITGGLLLMALAAVLTAGFLVERASPGDRLWGAHRLLEQVRVAAAISVGGRVDQLLDMGWRHLRRVSDQAERGALTAGSLDALLSAITDSYGGAIQLAGSAGDDRLRLRVAREAGDAAEELRRLSGQLPPGDEPPLVAAETLLRAMILRLGDRLAAGGASVIPTATAVPPTVAVSATAAAAEPGTGTPVATPPPLSLSTATPAATQVVALPPTAAATLTPSVAPTGLPTAVPASPEPTRRERTRTATPPPRPTDIPTTPLPAATGTAPPPTPTSDTWITPPAPPGAPSETPAAQP